MRKMLFTMTLALIVIAMSFAVFTATAEEPAPMETRASTHTVFAEDITATWCVHCTSASDNLEIIENEGNYDFRYVCLIDDMVYDAEERVNEYNPTGFPLVVFDGGYDEVSGNQTDTSNYEEAIENCETRTVPDLTVDVSCMDQGAGKLAISVDVTNNGGESYDGLLKVYVVERESRYFDYGGHYYPNGLLAFAMDESFSVDGASTYETSEVWDGGSVTDMEGNDFSDIEASNIDIYAVVFDASGNFKKHPGINAKTFTAHYVDGFGETQPVASAGAPQVAINTPTSGSTVSGTVDITATVSSDYSIDDVYVKVGTGDYMAMSASGSTYSYSWDSTTMNNGNIKITIKAIDEFNAEGLASLDVTVYNEGAKTPPEILSHNFNPAAPTADDTITFTVSINPNDATISDVKLQICRGTVCDLPVVMNEVSLNTYEYTTGTFTEGTDVGFTVMIYHDAGDVISSEWHVTIAAGAGTGGDGGSTDGGSTDGGSTDGGSTTDGETDGPEPAPGLLPSLIIASTLVALVAAVVVIGRRR